MYDFQNAIQPSEKYKEKYTVIALHLDGLGLIHMGVLYAVPHIDQLQQVEVITWA